MWVRQIINKANHQHVYSRAGRYCSFNARYIVWKNTATLLFIVVFKKTCELTVLLKYFDHFIDLVLQVPDFCLQ